MLYRINEAIRIKGVRLERGTVSKLEEILDKNIALLLKKKRISEVVSPPLSILPGFKGIAEGYAERGIHTVVDLAVAKDVPEADLEDALRWIEEPKGSTHVAPNDWAGIPVVPNGEADELDNEA